MVPSISPSSVSALVVLLLATATSAAAGGGLYGLTQQQQLMTVDTSTGAATPVPGSEPLPRELSCSQLSCVDASRGIAYFIGFNMTSRKPQAIGVSFTDGSLASAVDLPLAESELVGVGQGIACDEASGDLFVAGQMNASTFDHRLLRVNPKTGSTSTIASFKGIDVLGGPTAYAPDSGTVFTQAGGVGTINIVAIDVATGKVTNITQDYPTGHALTTMNYDAKRGAVVGTGIKPFGSSQRLFNRTVVHLDAKTYEYTVAGIIPGYGVINSDIQGYDASAGMLYNYLDKLGAATAKTPMYLVGSSVDDGSVKSAANVGPMGSVDMMWSLLYWDGTTSA